MKAKKFITLSAVLFLFFTLLVLTVPNTAYSGAPFSLGCCISEGPSPDCLGCGDLENCAIPQRTCLLDEGGGFFEGGSFCVPRDDGPDPSDARCLVGGDSLGCCVSDSGSCEDGVEVSSCGGDLWFIGNQCSEVPQCIQKASVPALSHWGIIVVAAIIGIVGFIVIRRKKVTA